MSILAYLKKPYVFLRYKYRKKRFGYFGKHTSLGKPLRITCPQNIYLEDYVCVAPYSWLAAEPHGGGESARLVIKRGCRIGDFAHIYATNEIVFEENVLLANYVYVSDTDHGYQNISIPILEQPIIRKSKVVIGEGSWLGEHVCVCGASIGKHCVIGANAVVNKDIPDYSIAVGVPAKVIKKYDFEAKQWIKV